MQKIGEKGTDLRDLWDRLSLPMYIQVWQKEHPFHEWVIYILSFVAKL